MEKLLWILFTVFVCYLTLTHGVKAAPSLPLSLYGSINPGGHTVNPATQKVEAKIQGQVFGTSDILTQEGGWIYSLDVLGDDPETPNKEGGVDGDTVTLWVSNLPASPTTTWQSGVSQQADLTLPAPTPTLKLGVFLNSATGLSCDDICSQQSKVCVSVGLEANARDTSMYSYFEDPAHHGQNHCRLVHRGATCQTEMKPFGYVCGGRQTEWILCKCEVPTPTNISTSILTPTPIEEVKPKLPLTPTPTLTSTPTLSSTPTPICSDQVDYNNDGKVSVVDFGLWLQMFIDFIQKGIFNDAADLNWDNKINALDFSCFLVEYNKEE